MAASLPRDRLILLVGLITYGMGQSLLFVIFAPLARQLGIEEWQLGFIIAASNVMLAFSAPRWGTASQSLGRRRVYLIGLGGYTLGYAALALGVQAGLWGWISAGPLFVLLLVLRMAYGIVVGGVSPAATAYIADTTDESSRAQGMALVGMALVMIIPKAEETAIKVAALLTSLVTLAIGIGILADFTSSVDLQPEVLNVGGGLGIAYTSDDEPPSIEDYVDVKVRGVERVFDPAPKILVEPARA